MRPGDLDSVLEIERASFSVPWTARTFRGLLERDGTSLKVAEDADPAAERGAGRELLGYAVLWRAADEAELGNLAVRESARRRGVGKALLHAVLEDARQWGVASVYLEVRVGNRAARALYARAGFREAGRRRNYYIRPREDAIVMRIALESEAEA